jgi:protein-S-isoprenylcysteine O-methyltransferase Ste14
MTHSIDTAIGIAWAGVALVWLAGLAFTKRSVRSQSASTRLFHLALGSLGFALLRPDWITTGWLAARFASPDGLVAILGLGLTVAGCCFAIWARIILGSNWSARATVKKDHELVITGPYALARHPIYTGLLAAIVGTALAFGAWHGILAVVILILALLIKMSQEERLMVQTFPLQYPAYRQRVKALIPGVF